MLDMIAGRSSSARGSELPHLQLGEGAPVALLINSLGATTHMELMVAARSALNHARESLQVHPPSCPPALSSPSVRVSTSVSGNSGGLLFGA